jgi:hypothetical protein
LRGRIQRDVDVTLRVAVTVVVVVVVVVVGYSHLILTMGVRHKTDAFFEGCDLRIALNELRVPSSRPELERLSPGPGIGLPLFDLVHPRLGVPESLFNLGRVRSEPSPSRQLRFQ